MVVRPHLHWFRLLFVWRGSVLGAILPQLCIATGFALVVALAAGHWPGAIPNLTPVPFTLLGIALAIFLGFSNSVSYDRYWEGRKLWGAVLNETRSLARQVITFANTSPAEKTAFIHALIAVVHALRIQLREVPGDDTLRQWLPDAVWQRVHAARFKPAIILLALGEQLRTMRERHDMSPILCAEMDRRLGLLTDALGGCERIATTPVPFAYTVILHRTIYVYSALLPFGIVSTLGLATPVIVLVVSYTFFALEALAAELRDPFGTEPNDLALDAMASTIDATLREMLGERMPEEPRPTHYVLR